MCVEGGGQIHRWHLAPTGRTETAPPEPDAARREEAPRQREARRTGAECFFVVPTRGQPGPRFVGGRGVSSDGATKSRRVEPDDAACPLEEGWFPARSVRCSISEAPCGRSPQGVRASRGGEARGGHPRARGREGKRARRREAGPRGRSRPWPFRPWQWPPCAAAKGPQLAHRRPQRQAQRASAEAAGGGRAHNREAWFVLKPGGGRSRRLAQRRRD